MTLEECTIIISTASDYFRGLAAIKKLDGELPYQVSDSVTAINNVVKYACLEIESLTAHRIAVKPDPAPTALEKEDVPF